MPLEASDDFVVPPPELSPEFKFDPQYNAILGGIAATNTIDIPWTLLSNIIKYKLAEVITLYLSQGKPWILAPEQAYEARTRAYTSLDSFDGAPFTIQRLAELILTPKLHYRSLPKYLRALNRVLNVSSERNAYTEDDSTFSSGLASGSGISSEEKYAELAMSDDDVGMMTPTKRPPPISPPSSTSTTSSSSTSSKSSTPLPSQPLLSPIPWLIHSSPTLSPTHPSTMINDPPHPPPSSSPPRIPSTTSSTNNPTSPHLSETLTPTGGVIDEVDPGSGGSETIEPVALTSSATVARGNSLEVPGNSTSTGGSGTTLRERFVRAGSPRVVEDEEREAKDEADVIM